MDAEESPPRSAPVRRRWRWWVPMMVSAALVAAFLVTVYSGFPGVRAPLRDAEAVARKINACAPGSATVNWLSGTVDTIGEPMDPRFALTSQERSLIQTNGKVGLQCVGQTIR